MNFFSRPLFGSAFAKGFLVKLPCNAEQRPSYQGTLAPSVNARLDPKVAGPTSRGAAENVGLRMKCGPTFPERFIACSTFVRVGDDGLSVSTVPPVGGFARYSPRGINNLPGGSLPSSCRSLCRSDGRASRCFRRTRNLVRRHHPGSRQQHADLRELSSFRRNCLNPPTGPSVRFRYGGSPRHESRTCSRHRGESELRVPPDAPSVLCNESGSLPRGSGLRCRAGGGARLRLGNRCGLCRVGCQWLGLRLTVRGGRGRTGGNRVRLCPWRAFRRGYAEWGERNFGFDQLGRGHHQRDVGGQRTCLRLGERRGVSPRLERGERNLRHSGLGRRHRVARVGCLSCVRLREGGDLRRGLSRPSSHCHLGLDQSSRGKCLGEFVALGRCVRQYHGPSVRRPDPPGLP